MKKNNEPHHGRASDIIRASKALKEQQAAILKAMYSIDSYIDGFNYVGFGTIARKTKIEYKRVRVVVRQLARKGLTHYSSGLFHEDGTVAGSGYCLTKLGGLVVQIISEDEKQPVVLP